jgi:hypothetical protein
VATDCSAGSPSYQAWYEMYPASPVYYNDPVSAGDSFSASVTTDGGGNYTLTISDDTQGALDASNSSGFEDHTSTLSGGGFSVAYQQE